MDATEEFRHQRDLSAKEAQARATQNLVRETHEANKITTNLVERQLEVIEKQAKMTEWIKRASIITAAATIFYAATYFYQVILKH